MARQFFIKDKNLKPENIKQGVKILNVTGTYEGSGPSDVEQWPDLLQVQNDAGGVHGGVVFDTGFPIADDLVNNSFEGYFALGQSMEYMEENSCYLFGNASAVDPETGVAYYWGIWQAYGNINVAFGSRSEYAVFPLSEDGEEGTVSPYDLPVTWNRMKNPGPEVTGFDSVFVYEVKIGNLVKYAPAHDERMELFNGLNMCVFGRNVEGDSSVYSGHADSGTYSAWLYAESTDEGEISHSLDLVPYILNESVTFYETYNIDGETEYDGPLEPILDTHGTVTNISFDVDMGADLQVTPSDKEQHIATINSNTIIPYVTVNPMILVSKSETITENDRFVISASNYGADGISEITLDISVGGGGGSDWLADALAGNITDLSGYELPGLSGEGRYSYLFANTPIVKTPNINGALDGKHIAYCMFSDCSALTEADLSNLTSLKGYNMEAGYNMFRNCTNLVSVDLSGLVEVKGQYACGSMFYNCTSLEYVNLGSLSNIGSYTAGGPFYSMFNNCTNLTDVTIHPKAIETSNSGWNPLETAVYIENLTLSDTASNDIRLKWQPNLTADSVLNVLSNLDLTVSGNSVMFYDNGLTIQDDAQGSIQTAYDDAVDAGWTIYNLTITPDPGR